MKTFSPTKGRCILPCCVYLVCCFVASCTPETKPASAEPAKRTPGPWHWSMAIPEINQQAQSEVAVSGKIRNYAHSSNRPMAVLQYHPLNRKWDEFCKSEVKAERLFWVLQADGHWYFCVLNQNNEFTAVPDVSPIDSWDTPGITKSYPMIGIRTDKP